MAASIIAWATIIAGCGNSSDVAPEPTPGTYTITPLWRDQFDSGTSAVHGFDRPNDAVASDGIVVVSGAGGTNYGISNAILRAYKGSSGKLLWENTVDGIDCGAAYGQLFVIGSRLLAQTADCHRVGIRAFDLRSGHLDWSTMTEGPSLASVLASDGTHLASFTSSDAGFRIEMHDASDGTILWSKNTGLLTFPHAVSSDRVLVVAGGYAVGEHRYEAYDTKTGEKLWTAYPRGNGYSDPVYVIAMAQGLLVSAGWPGYRYGARLTVRDELTGKVLWRETTGIGVRSIAIDAERIYIAGTFPVVKDKFAVAAYSRSTGKLLWLDIRHHRGVSEHAEWAITTGDRLLVGGQELQLRAYNAATGEVLEQVFQDLGDGAGRALVAESGNIYSLAGVLEPDAAAWNNEDFLVRAFRQVSR